MVKAKKTTREIRTMVPPTIAMDATQLVPAKYNPRKITPDQFDSLKQSVRDHGFIQSMVVQKKGTAIIGGHQRLRALTDVCQELGVPVPKVPCIILDIDDRAARLLNIKLNRVGGEFDQPKLGEVLKGLKMEVPALVAGTGMTEREIERALQIANPPKLNVSVPTFANSVTLSLEFGDVATRDSVKAWLQERVKLTKKRTGEVVAELIG